MPNLNKVVVAGHLGKDPEIKTLGSGTKIAKFSMAVNSGWGEKKKTSWLNIVCFGHQATYAEKYFSKGQAVFVDGRIEIDKGSDGRYWTNIVADNVSALGHSEKQTTQNSGYSNSFSDDDIPF
jgi:single-strand DNA-binding protein